jgi:hypothetical protein
MREVFSSEMRKAVSRFHVFLWSERPKENPLGVLGCRKHERAELTIEYSSSTALAWLHSWMGKFYWFLESRSYVRTLCTTRIISTIIYYQSTYHILNSYEYDVSSSLTWLFGACVSRNCHVSSAEKFSVVNSHDEPGWIDWAKDDNRHWIYGSCDSTPSCLWLALASIANPGVCVCVCVCMSENQNQQKASQKG